MKGHQGRRPECRLGRHRRTGLLLGHRRRREDPGRVHHPRARPRRPRSSRGSHRRRRDPTAIADIIPTSLRDLFGHRIAFRCTTDSSSDIILGQGWAKEGHSAKKILPTDLGVGLLLAEGGTPARIKTANLTDEHIQILVQRAAWIRGYTGGDTA